MRIGLVWKNDYPWDVRVEKLATTLAAAGHQVVILAANAAGRVEEEEIGPVQIRRLPPGSRWMNRIVSMPFYFNPWWVRLAERVMDESPLDLVIVRDLPLIHVGLHLRRRHGIPIVLDMAENYPAMYREAVRDGGVVLGGLRWLLKNPQIMTRVERAVLPQLDHVLVVVEESAERVSALGVDAARITVVGNTPRVATMLASRQRPPLGARPLHLIYTGFVQDGRGLETVVGGLRRLRERGQSARFTVVGDGGYRSRLEALVSEAGVADLVQFSGWVPHERLAEYIAQADVGVIPHPKNEHTDSTIPNKLFDYMLQALPVLVSDAAPLQRIVSTEQCGEVFRTRDDVSLAEAILRLMQTPELTQMGCRGAAAVQRRYHWDFDAAALCRVINSVPRQRASAAAA